MRIAVALLMLLFGPASAVEGAVWTCKEGERTTFRSHPCPDAETTADKVSSPQGRRVAPVRQPAKEDKPGFMSKCRADTDCPKTMICSKREGKEVGVCAIPLAPIKKR